MSWFRCFIEGENFFIRMGGQQALFGFFTTRWVEARDAEEAERKAVDLIRRDDAFKDMKPGKTEPRVRVSEIEEAPQPPENPEAGFTFFQMKP